MRLRPFAKERDVALFCCALALAITLLLPPPKSDEEKRESRFRDIHTQAIAKAEEYAYLPKVARYAPFQDCRFEETAEGIRVHIPATITSPDGPLTGEIRADVRDLVGVKAFKFHRFDFIPANN